ncbi:MAG: ATP-binding protein [Kofleriaceae bacterium]
MTSTTGVLRKLAALPVGLVNACVPARLASDPETLRKARFAVSVACVSCVFSVIMGVKYANEGATQIRDLIAIHALFFPVALLVMRTTGSYRAVGHMCCAIFWSLFFNLALVSGGLAAPNMVSNTFVVFMASMVVGPRAGIGWLVSVIGTYVAQYLLTSRGLVTQTLSSQSVANARLAELIASTVGCALAAYLYETGKRRMLAAITAEKTRVEDAHRDIRVLLDSTGQGFVSLDPAGRLIGERSAVVDRWFGKPGEHEPFHTYIERCNESFGVMFELCWGALVDEVLPFELGVDQLPKRMTHGATTFSFEYRFVLGAHDEVVKAVVIISDVTARLENEVADLRQRDLLAAFKGIRQDQDHFARFLQQAHETATQMVDQAVTPELARALHTLKGNAGMMELSGLAALCHRLEGEIAEDGEAQDESVQTLVKNVAQVEELMGRLLVTRDPDEVRLTAGEYRGFLARLEASRWPSDLAGEVRLWRLPPIARELDRLVQQASALAQRLGKGELVVSIEDRGICLEQSPAWDHFWSSLVHVVRNAIDHGIEPAAERIAAGKPRARLSIGARLSADELAIEVRDDGRGIDWEAVGRRARHAGLPSASEADLIEALFADGLTTRETASDVSGRGVGLGAARSACQDLGGRIEVVTVPRVGTTFRFLFARDALRVGERPSLAQAIPVAPPASFAAAARS